MSLMTRQSVVDTNVIPKDFVTLQETLALLRPIRSQTVYAKALRIASDLASCDRLSRIQADYLQVLTNNIKVYEDKYLMTRKYTPLEVLRFLLDENGMSGSDLGRILGQRTLGPKILKEERGLSKAHIRKLAARFSVEPGLFI